MPWARLEHATECETCFNSPEAVAHTAAKRVLYDHGGITRTPIGLPCDKMAVTGFLEGVESGLAEGHDYLKVLMGMSFITCKHGTTP